MYYVNKWIAASIALCAIHVAFADANPQHIVWDRTPINVVLPIGEERMISFPGAVQFGMPSDLSDSLSVQNNQGTLYLTASQSFKPERVEVRDSQTGNIVLFNFSATTSARPTSDVPLEIVYQSDKTINANADSSLSDKVSYIDLTRYAWQQLYAPKRLLTQPNNINLVETFDSKNVRLFYDNSVVALPVASWRGGDYYITAVQIRNMLNTTIDINPNIICGSWSSVTFYPSWELTPAGSITDGGYAFLISSEPFDQDIAACKG